MGRTRAYTHSLALVPAAALMSYLLTDWQPRALSSTELSAAQTVALRFPNDSDGNPAASIAPPVEANAGTIGELALFSPEPMGPAVAMDSDMPPVMAEPAMIQSAAPAVVDAPNSMPTSPAPRSLEKVASPAAAKPVPRVTRARFALDDADIARIKEHLHLTPDQQRMWPPVEAALRNLAYRRAREARRRGGAVQLADADSTEVQGLKSAAIPLLMSFNDEQKDEVRSLAHGMGLDRLANEF
jgi:hypothetical protein